MDAGEFQRHPFRDHPLFAAGMDEQQVFLPVLEKPEIAPWIALLGRDLQSARRRCPARHRSSDIGLDALEGVDGDALALAQPMHQLAVIDRPPTEGRFGNIVMAAKFGNLAEDLVVFHRAWVCEVLVGSGDSAGVLPPSAHRRKSLRESRKGGCIARSSPTMAWQRNESPTPWRDQIGASFLGDFIRRRILMLTMVAATLWWSEPILAQPNAQLG